MSWVTVIWSMVASACLTLAVIYFVVWWTNRTAWAHLLFSITAASTTGVAFCELAMMRAQTGAELVAALQWAQLFLFFLFTSIPWFVRFHLRAGSAALAWVITALRTIYVPMTFLAAMNINQQAMSSLRRVDFLGEPVTLIGGTLNPLTLFGQFGVFLIVVFVVDAAVTAWQRGDRRKAWMVGGSLTFFILAGLGTTSLILWGNVQAPTVVSQCYLGMVVVMGYELSRDLLRTSQLVNELQVSEAGLRESEARMSLAVEAGDFGIWVTDLVRREVWASDSWRTMFGFRAAERLTFDEVLERLHPEDRDVFRHTHEMAFAGSNGGHYQVEHRLMLPDGSIRWIASRGRVEIDIAGRPALIRGTSRETTATKRAEQEMLLLRQEIAHAGRVSMMGQLASALAHEINQPLASILRNTEAAELFLKHPSPDLEEIQAILVDIREDDERAGAVIDRMRGLLKRHTLETRQLDVRALVGDVAALVRVDAATRRVKLAVEVPTDLPPVHGDRVHLQQVLLNLILNGMDALNGASVENRRVDLTARCNNRQIVEIAVGDAGPGIPAEALAHIFDPFFTTKPNGMGMGLAISRTIVEAHGGQLWAENKGAGGAMFRFTLPIANEGPA